MLDHNSSQNNTVNFSFAGLLVCVATVCRIESQCTESHKITQNHTKSMLAILLILLHLFFLLSAMESAINIVIL